MIWRNFREKVVRCLRFDNQSSVDVDDVDNLNVEIGLGLSMYCQDAYEIFVPYQLGQAQGAYIDLQEILQSPVFEPDQVWLGGRELDKVSYDQFRTLVDVATVASGTSTSSAASRYAHVGEGKIIVDAYLPDETTIAVAGWAGHPAYQTDDDRIMVATANIETAARYCAKQLMSAVVSDADAMARLARYDRSTTDAVALARSRNMARYFAGMSRE